MRLAAAASPTTFAHAFASSLAVSFAAAVTRTVAAPTTIAAATKPVPHCTVAAISYAGLVGKSIDIGTHRYR